MNKRKLLEDLLLKSVAVKIEVSEQNSARTENKIFESQLTNSETITNCFICGCKNEDLPVPGTLFRPLEERERRLLSLCLVDGPLFLCPFCFKQLDKLDKLKKKVKRLQQEYYAFLDVIKTVMKMGCGTTYFGCEDEEMVQDSETVFQDILEEGGNSICSFSGDQLWTVKEEIEEVLVEHEWLLDLNESKEEVSAMEVSPAADPFPMKKTIKKRKISSVKNHCDPQTTLKTRSKRNSRIKEEESDDETDRLSNYSPTPSSEDEDEGEEYQLEKKRKVPRKEKIQDSEDSKIECEICQVSHPNMESYKRHLHGWKHFVEEECKEAVKRKDQTNQDSFLCPNCDSEDDAQTFPSIEDLRSHYNTFHKKGRLVCKPCGKVNTQGWTHFRKHTKGERHLILKNSLNQTQEEIQAKLPFECLHCFQRFTNEKSLHSHINMHTIPRTNNRIIEKIMSICETCGRSFTTAFGLDRHREAAHKEEEFPGLDKTIIPKESEQVKCHKCPKLFTTRVKMREHFRNIHLRMHKKWYRCEQCENNFSSKHYLERHQRVIHNNIRLEEKLGKVPCPVPSCRKKEIVQSRFYPHLEVKHFIPWGLEGTEGSECQCPFECGTSCNVETDWVQHVNNCSVGKESKEKPARCKKCNAVFPSQFTRLSHQLQAHPEAAYTCEFCSRPFTTAAALEIHVSIHPESRPHLCAKCGKSFRFLASLHGHQRTVCNDDEEEKKAFIEKQRAKCKRQRQKRKQFKCLQCSKGFGNEKRLRDHSTKCYPEI